MGIEISAPVEIAAAWNYISDSGMVFKQKALEIASLLTDPICKVREYFYTLYAPNDLVSAVSKVATTILLVLGILFYALLTPLTAPLGAAIRGTVAYVETKPYIYLEQAREGKRYDGHISFAFHNVCFMPGGYSISDGGVTPPSDRARVEANLKQLKELSPDIIALSEVPDIRDANYLTSQLSEYPFVIPVAGVRAIGPSSMLYVASKYKLDAIEFIPFEKGTELTGRAANSEKGFLVFDAAPTVSVIVTHLQHSEMPTRPTELDVASRAAQMRKIAHKIEQKVNQGKTVIFAGDLNQSEEELNRFFTTHNLQWLRDSRVQGQATWGGDRWCAELEGKEACGPEVLDYVFVAGKAMAMETAIVSSGFDGNVFSSKALSDHNLLFSNIII